MSGLSKNIRQQIIYCTMYFPSKSRKEGDQGKTSCWQKNEKNKLQEKITAKCEHANVQEDLKWLSLHNCPLVTECHLTCI